MTNVSPKKEKDPEKTLSYNGLITCNNIGMMMSRLRSTAFAVGLL